MESLSGNKVLQFHSDTLVAVRKEFNLDKPGKMCEAIELLDGWVKKQDHFVKKDFSKDYLERTIITTKGSVERAKQRMDKLCTLKTLMPNFYHDTDIKKQYENFQNFGISAHLPKMTKDNYRVYAMRLYSDKLDSSIIFNYYKYVVMLSEYLKANEYCSGFIIVLDLTDVNIVSLVSKLNPIELQQAMTLITEGYGMRIKGIHLITPSKMVDGLVSLFKQVLSAKVASRIHIHKSMEPLYEHVPRDIMPADFGGEERLIKNLNDEWIEVLSSKKFTEYLREMNNATTNESCRHTSQFNEQYLGTPGTFRTMSVD